MNWQAWIAFGLVAAMLAQLVSHPTGRTVVIVVAALLFLVAGMAAVGVRPA